MTNINCTDSGWFSKRGDGELVKLNDVLTVGNNDGNDEAWLIHRTPIPVSNDIMYRLRLRLKNTGSRFYLGVSGVRADGITYVNSKGFSSTGSQHYVYYGSDVLNEFTTIEGFFYSGDLGGYSEIPEKVIKLHDSVVFFKPTVIVNYKSKGIANLESFVFDKLTNIFVDTGMLSDLEDSHLTMLINGVTVELNYNICVNDVIELITIGEYDFSVGGNYISDPVTGKRNNWVVDSDGKCLLTVTDDDVFSNLFFKTEIISLLKKTFTYSESWQFTYAYVDLYVNGVYDTVEDTEIMLGDVLEIKVNTEKSLISRGVWSIMSTGNYISDPVTGKRVNWVVDSGNKTATMVVGSDFPDGNLVFNTGNIYPVLRVISESDIEMLESKKLTMFVDGVAVVLGSEWLQGNELTIVPYDGYMIVPENYMMEVVSNRRHEWEITADGKLGSYDLHNGLDSEVVLVFSTLEIPEGLVSPSSSISDVYLVDEDTANKLVKGDYPKMFDEQGKPLDFYADSLISLIKIPFKIDDKYIGDRTEITLHTDPIDLFGKIVGGNVLMFDMGVVSAPHINNNSTDYEGVTAELYLPYSEPISLNVLDVIGFDISIKYYMSVHNGDTVINVTSSNTDSIIASKNITMSVSVPFAPLAPSTNEGSSSDKFFPTEYNDIPSPYLEIKSLGLTLVNGIFTNPIIDESSLSDVKGFVTVENIDLKTSSNSNEKENILTLLKQGIIIK